MSITVQARWLVIAAVVAADAVGLRHLGMRLVPSGLVGLGLALTLCAAIALFYTRWRPDERLADLAHLVAQLFAFFAAAGVFSYILMAASAPVPPVDDALTRADLALGFDWRLWFLWTQAHPLLGTVFQLVYMSALPQIAIITLYLSLTGQRECGSEFLWTIMLSLLIIIPLSALFPAMSAFAYHQMGLEKASFLHDLAGLRRGEIHEIDLARMQGVIAFPSFHTTLAVLFVYVLRKRRAPFVIAALVNGLMLLSIPSEGGHYLMDVIAGAVTTFVAILATRWLERLFNRLPMGSPAPDAAG